MYKTTTLNLNKSVTMCNGNWVCRWTSPELEITEKRLLNSRSVFVKPMQILTENKSTQISSTNCRRQIGRSSRSFSFSSVRKPIANCPQHSTYLAAIVKTNTLKPKTADT